MTDAGRLVTLETVTANGEWVPNYYPDYIYFRDYLKLFDGIAVSRPSALSVGRDEHSERVWGRTGLGQFLRGAGR